MPGDARHERESQGRMAVVAVMQPYFYPYAGYFRLLAAADTFVIYDDVQFPRRGRVHRCEVPGSRGVPEWLALPLARAPRDVLVAELAFAAGARAELDARLARLTWLARANGPLAERVRDHLFGRLGTPLDFIEAGLRLVAGALGLPARIVRSSALGVDASLGRQERIIALVEAAGGSVYVNAPNGRALYDAHAFHARELGLQFLEPYRGSFQYLLPALVAGDPASLRDDVLATARITD